MMIDLHSHTTASDGNLTPSQLVRKAKALGISALAITDHDTILGLEQAIAEAENIGDIEVIPGVEISTDSMGDLHILGYFIDYHDQRFLSRLEAIRTKRDIRNDRMIEKFKNIGIEISITELKEIAMGESIGRPHFAELLKKKGIVNSAQEAFDKYLVKGGACFVPRENLEPREAIEVICDGGGIAVLAHPVHLNVKSKDGLKNVLIELISYGLSGIEVYHSDHQKKYVKLYLELCEELNLCATGGSDFHGRKTKPSIRLGKGRGALIIPYEILDNLKKKWEEKKLKV